jgi:hypothetical protein
MTAKAVWKRTWSIISCPFRFLWSHKGWVFLILFLLIICYGGYRTVKWGVEKTSTWANKPKVEKVEKVQPPTPAPTVPKPAEANHRVAPPAGQFQVRELNQSARWDGVMKVWKDKKGEFITPPNVHVWRTDLDIPGWYAPFDEWAEFHPDQAEEIVKGYIGKAPVYLNKDNIIRRYGQVATPPTNNS